MKDGPLNKTKYELHKPIWYDVCYSYLSKKEAEEFVDFLNVYMSTSATREELLNMMTYKPARIMFNCVALDAEQQIEKQQPKRIRNSGEYKEWREAVFKRDNYTCQNCMRKGGKLNAHHIKHFKDYPDLRLDIENGITLCVDCHHAVHRGEISIGTEV